tara:strand:- start:2118 stop:2450 length:333 start_codon:yes stop_codon:yes gene_type:complete
MESTFKLERKLSSSVVTLKLENQTHVPDLATKIRILPGVAVVGQKTKVARFMDGDALLTLSIKYLPQTDEIFRSLKDISLLIKKLPGVKSVTVETFNKRKITLKGKKIIF